MRKNGIVLMCALLIIVGGFGAVNDNVTGESASDVQELWVNVTVVNGYTQVWIWQQFENPGDDMDTAEIRITLPDGAFITNFTTVCNGEARYARIEDAETAEEIFEEAAAAGEHTALVSDTRGRYFTTRIAVPAGSTVKAGLCYEYQLLRTRGEYRLNVPLKGCKFERRFQGLAIDVDVRMSDTITGFAVPESPFPMDDFGAAGGHGWAHCAYRGTPIHQSLDNLNVTWTTGPTSPEGWMTTWSEEECVYFQHVIVPNNAGGEEYLPKDIVFVLDKSGSMSGEKISQVKTAFKSIVETLPPEDRFNVVVFSSSSSSHYDGLVPATGENLERSAGKIDSLYGSGGTDINNALKVAFGHMEQGENTPIIILLTDGRGKNPGDVVRANVRAWNDCGAALYTIGFGYDVEAGFLEAMALENNGFYTQVNANGDAALQLTDFYRTVSTPLLSNVTVSYEPAPTDVVGNTAMTVFNGSQMQILGIFPPGTESVKVTISGTDHDGNFVISGVFDLTTAGEMEFVKRAYYFGMLNDVLDRIKVEGEKDYLVEKAAAIALDNSFVTEYTSLILTEEQTLSKEWDNSESADGTNGLYTSNVTYLRTDSTVADAPDYGGGYGKESGDTGYMPFPSAAMAALMLLVGVIAAAKMKRR